jgi:DNA-binding beta-propeller fold protein YncE
MLLSAAVGLADDAKPKPRAKLLGTLKVKKAVEQVVFSPDGKHLIVFADGNGLVVPREQLGEDATPKPVSEFDLPVGSGMHYGVTPDGAEVYVLFTAGSRFNAETRLCFWAVKDLADGKKKAKPDRAVSLEVDNPTSFALTGDGKSLFVVAIEPRAGAAPPGQPLQQVGKVFRLSARTGDIADEVMTLDEKEASLVGAVVHPESGRVYAHFQTADEHVVKGLEMGTKKAVWTRRFDEPPPGPSNIGPRVSPDGKAVVAFPTRQILAAPVLPGQPAPGNTMSSSPQLLDTAKGEVVADLGGEDVNWSGVHAFSPDGKLTFGWLSRNSGVTQFVAWDTKAGKPLKTWARGASIAAAAFAPAGHLLAVVERTEVYQHVPAYSPSPFANDPIDFRGFDSSWVIRQPQQPLPPPPEVSSIVGVWDLAPLVK